MEQSLSNKESLNPYIVGEVSFQSKLKIEDVAEILSEKLFGGLKFGGKEMSIHEEIPAVFIQSPFLGFKVVLDGYPGFGYDENYTLYITPWYRVEAQGRRVVTIDNHLINLLKNVFNEDENLKLLITQ